MCECHVSPRQAQSHVKLSQHSVYHMKCWQDTPSSEINCEEGWWGYILMEYKVTWDKESDMRI